MPWPSLGLGLPSNLQNRVISYILRRTLGKFVKAGLDVDEVQAQLAQGAVDLDALEIDPDGIQQLLVGMPLTIKGGTVDHVSARFSGWALAIVVDRLELNATLSNSPIDLSHSFAAREDLVESLTDTLAQSLADLDLNAPGAFPTGPVTGLEEDESSMLAGLVEQLVSRLTVQVNTVIVRLDHGVEYDLRVDKIVYDRGITLSGITVRMEHAESEEEEEEDGYSDMLMSQAVGDLRQSTATVYASAYGSTMAVREPPVLRVEQVTVKDGRVEISPIVVNFKVWHLEALLRAVMVLHGGRFGPEDKEASKGKEVKLVNILLSSLDVTLGYQDDGTLRLLVQGVRIAESIIVNSVSVDDLHKGTCRVLNFTTSPAISIGEKLALAPINVELQLALVSRLLPLRSVFDFVTPIKATSPALPPPTPSPSTSRASKNIFCPSIRLSIIPLHSTSTTLTIKDFLYDYATTQASIDEASLECITQLLTLRGASFNHRTHICKVPSVFATLDRPTVEALQFVVDDVTHWLATIQRAEAVVVQKEDAKGLPIKVVIDNVNLTLFIPTHSGPRTVKARAGAAVELGPTIHLAINDLEVDETTQILHGAIDLHFGPSAARETSIDLALIGLSLDVTTDLSLAQDLAKFIKAPEGVFADVVPSEVTHVTVRLDECSVKATLPNGSLKLVVHSAAAKTDITVGENALETQADVEVFIAETDVFVPLITASCDASLKKEQMTKLDVTNLKFRLAACADSLATMTTLIGDISNSFPKRSELSAMAIDNSPLPPPPPPAAPIDVFASIDDEAFRATPYISAGADMIDDDLPTHREYLDGSESADAIRILYDTPFALDDYWHGLQPVEETFGGQLQIRVACEGEILLHDGYDWESTREAIEDETQAVRLRLDKIRQLLAAGQTPDPSMERTSVLFNSIYIDPEDAWESLETETQDMPVKSPKRTRSKRPLIEIAVRVGKVELDGFDAGEVLSRLHCTVQSVDILDHIKTSTWKTFLTEKRGGVRETGADMVRIELLKVRLGAGEEARLKIKVLPLRLHVDQDALDFLKRFFGFKQGGEGSPVFFQHVEVYPVELKLDYKPKRVDLAALRHGRIIELMNFFHFDGAEMTLRHVTLSGIKSSDLSTTLNDLWTPDVKAHQLADVISGVSPIRSMVNVGSGVADLILLPLEQYRKDGRVTRGVQRGTTSFMRTTAMEGLKLGARLATGTQVVLEHAEMVLGGRGVELDSDAISRYANQPQDAREGIQAAYRSLATNVNSAAQTILAVPMEVYDENSSMKAVVRAVPIAVLKPMIGATEAVSKTLLGLRNGMSAEARLEQEEKYKR